MGNGARSRPVTHEVPQAVFLLTALTLAVGVALTSATGLILVSGKGSDLGVAALFDVRRTLVAAAGALFFGAGLVRLSAHQVAPGAISGRQGPALIVLGLSVTLVSSLGPLLHDSPQAKMLNPLAAAIVASTTLVVMVARRGVELENKPHPAWHTLCWLFTPMAAITGVALLRGLTGASLDPSPVVQVSLELAIASMWFAAAFTAARHKASLAEAADVDLALLVGLGVAWLMRAGAVVDPVAWGLASALLLALVALIGLTASMTALNAARESQLMRLATAEAAFESTAQALAAQSRQCRDVRHGSRNSMLALRLTSQALANGGADLDPEARLALSKAMVKEVVQLESLLSRLGTPSVPGWSATTEVNVS